MMDKQHKEELEQNDLREFLTHLGEFWQKHSMTILVVVLVAVAAYVLTNWYRTKDRKNQEAAWTEIYVAETPAAYSSAANTHAKLPGASGYALLNAADQMYGEVVYGIEPGTVPDATVPRLSEEKVKKLSTEVVPLYEKVINGPHAHEPSLVKLNARFGLAATLTSIGQINEAGEQYDLIIAEAGVYKTLASIAESKKERLSQLAGTIAFAAPAPALSLPPVPDTLGGTKPFPDSPTIEGLTPPKPVEAPTTQPAETPQAPTTQPEAPASQPTP